VIVYTVREASRICRVPQRTIRRWMAAKSLATLYRDGVKVVPAPQVEHLAGLWHNSNGKRRARPRGLPT
jgi:hypothetical protein